MNKLLIIVIGVYFLLCPFYFFDSGIPQPAHFIAVIGFLALFFGNGLKELFKAKTVIYLFLFSILTLVINIAYFFYFREEVGGKLFLLHSTFYVFNFLFFLLFLKILVVDSPDKSINKIVIFLLISLGIQFTLSVFDFNKVTQYIVTGRSVNYFNNPNQLGYFTLLMLTLFTVLPSKFRDQKGIVLGVVITTIGLAIFSSSRLTLIGVVILTLLLLYQMGLRFKAKYWVIALVAVLISGSFFYKTDFIQKKIALVEIRNHRQDTTGISEAQIRGYDRIWLHPKYTLYGAGEGKYDRFSSYQKGELHSGFGTVLFSYGILGLVLLLFFFFSAIRHNMVYNIVLLTPILLYNLAHQGFRNPIFWAVLAAISVCNSKSK